MEQDNLFAEYKGVFVENEEVEKKEKSEKKKWGEEKYNVFALPDAVGRRSAKDAWVEFMVGRVNGAEAEEIHARIWGKVRDMLSVRGAQAEELGLHPFVYKKAKADLVNWKEEELLKFADDLVEIYHHSRLGRGELDVALERQILSI